MFEWISVSHALTNFSLLRFVCRIMDWRRTISIYRYWIMKVVKFWPYDEKVDGILASWLRHWTLSICLAQIKAKGTVYVCTCVEVSNVESMYIVIESLTWPCIDSMMYLRQLLGSFVLVHVLCDGIELNSTECVKTCKKEVRIYSNAYMWCW
jgi:hypothetical protein